jgi:hypothetical protein
MIRLASRTALARGLAGLTAGAAVVLSLIAPASASPTDRARNGAPDRLRAAETSAPVVVGTGWQEVTFGDVGSRTVLRLNAPGETWLRLTDMFCAGDQFSVLDNGVPLQATAPATAATCERFTSSPTRAEVGAAWSSGGWLLRAGQHTLTMITTGSPFGGGVAFVRADAPALATARLRGESEVPGPGDADGVGTAVTLLSAASGRVCYVILVDRLDDVIAGHIHRGGPTVAGPIVVNLQLQPGRQRVFASCVPADREVVRAIAFAPWDHYLNVHTTVFPAGAIRGQLQPPRTP